MRVRCRSSNAFQSTVYSRGSGQMTTSPRIFTQSGEASGRRRSILDDAFAKEFREHSTAGTRLLVFLDEPIPTDRLVSRLVDMQIRTSQRIHLIESPVGDREAFPLSVKRSLLNRLSSALATDQRQGRILNATIQNAVLRLVSPNLERLDVSISEIPQLKNLPASDLQAFQIDEDGSFIYWPSVDVHLGWNQLQHLVDPGAALKAAQKSRDFNKLYGRAVRHLREKAGISASEVKGISEKQLRRIEAGDCRLTSNAIEALSEAHGMKGNAYLQKLAESLPPSASSR